MDAPSFIEGLLGLDPPAPPDDPDEAARLVRFHGLEGLAMARDRTGPQFLPAALAGEWEGVWRVQGLANALLLESMQRARAVLELAGIQSVAFKGAALLADGRYDDPGARRMDDADLVVEQERAREAVEQLMGAGFRPVVPWTPDLTGWSDSLTLHDTRGPEGMVQAIDLHWRTEYDRLRFGAGGGSVLLTGASADGLPTDEAHLVVVAEHLLKHLRYKVHLAAYGDLARLAAGVRVWDRVEGLVRASRLERGLRAILAVVRTRLGGAVPDALTRGHAPALAVELAPATLAGRARSTEGRLAGVVHRWRLIGAPGRVIRDVAEAAVPSSAWLRARYGSAGARTWLRYLADVSRWVAGQGRSPASPHQELFDPRSRE